MTFERNVVHISAGLNQADYAKHFRKLFYTSPKQHARKLFDTLEEKLSDDRVVFPSILTTDTIYAILHGVDLKKEENQFVLIEWIRKDANIRNFLFGDAFELSNAVLPTISTTVSSITLDDLRLSKKEEKKIFGDAKLSYDIYLGYNSTQRSNLGSQVNSKSMVNSTLKKHVPLKVDPILSETRTALKNLLETDIEFAFNLLSETPVFDGVNADLLVGIANENPGAALGILGNPNLNTIISKAQAETIFANLLNKSRDKKVTPILRDYVMNLIDTDPAAPAPEFAAVQLQTLFNHPSRIAEELKIPTDFLKKYWNEGNFEDKSDENKANFLKANDPTNPNNPRKKHWFRNWFPNWNKAFFDKLYSVLKVEIKYVAAPAQLAPPPPPVETAEEIQEKQARARVAELAARKAAAEVVRLEKEINEAQEEIARLAAEERKTAPEFAQREKEINKTQEEIARLAAEERKTAAEFAQREKEINKTQEEIARLEKERNAAQEEVARLKAETHELAQKLEKDVALFEAEKIKSDANIARIEREVQKRAREERQRAEAAANLVGNIAELITRKRKGSAAEIKPIPAPPAAPLLPTFETNEQIQARHASKRAARLADLAEKKRVQQPVAAAVAPASTTETALPGRVVVAQESAANVQTLEVERHEQHVAADDEEAQRKRTERFAKKNQADDEEFDSSDLLEPEQITSQNDNLVTITPAPSAVTAPADATETTEQGRAITETLQKRITAAVAAQKEASAKHEQAEAERKKAAEKLAKDVARLTAEAKAAEETAKQEDSDEAKELQPLFSDVPAASPPHTPPSSPRKMIAALQSENSAVETSTPSDIVPPSPVVLGRNSAAENAASTTSTPGDIVPPSPTARRNSIDIDTRTLPSSAKKESVPPSPDIVPPSPVATRHTRNKSYDEKMLSSAEKRKQEFEDTVPPTPPKAEPVQNQVQNLVTRPTVQRNLFGSGRNTIFIAANYDPNVHGIIDAAPSDRRNAPGLGQKQDTK